jgi:hypothetical protein
MESVVHWYISTDLTDLGLTTNGQGRMGCLFQCPISINLSDLVTCDLSGTNYIPSEVKICVTKPQKQPFWVKIDHFWEVFTLLLFLLDFNQTAWTPRTVLGLFLSEGTAEYPF